MYGLCEHREWWKGKEAGSDGGTQALLMTGQIGSVGSSGSSWSNHGDQPHGA